MDSEKTKRGKHMKSPLHLKFDDLVVKVGEKYILKHVTGEVKPGEILAIMGPSGAGKSTLLNILAGRFNGMELESGSVLVNNQKMNKQLRRKIGYVTQEDVFFNHLTVRQTLQFVTDIVLPETLCKETKEEIFNDVVDTLSLKKCLDTAIGGGIFTSGCSGGEKKRCSIAIELIKNPSLLILDEPTSGLDAAIACSLITSIKSLATTNNCAVITSIHQPSSHIFHMFDKLLLLCNGSIAYYGQTNGVLTFFDSIGMPCYPNWNPADYILEKVSDGNEEKIIEMFAKYESPPVDKPFEDSKEIPVEGNTSYLSDDSVVHFVNGDHTKPATGSIETTDSVETYINVGYESNDEGCNPDKEIHNSESIEINFDEEKASEIDIVIPDNQKWPTGFRTQFTALARRAFVQTKENVFDKISIFQTFGVALTCFLIWFNIPYTEDTITDRRGAMFYLITYQVFNPMFTSLFAFGPERDAITKERSNGMYRLSAYFMAKNISELPVIIIQPFLFYTLIYWGAGLNRSPIFLVGLLLILTICFTSQTFGYCFGCAVKNLKKALSSAVVFALANMLLGGFYARRVPSWLVWTKYISFVSHAYNIQHRLEFEFATKTFSCSTGGSMFNECKANGTHVIHGSDVEEKFSTLSVGIGGSFLVLWAYIIIFRTLFYFLLKFLYRAK